MDSLCPFDSCQNCPAEFLCHCLRVTEEMLTEAVERYGLRTLNDVRRHTGAGEGCTACHRKIRMHLEVIHQSSSSDPICSVR